MEKYLLIVILIGVMSIRTDALCTQAGNCDNKADGINGKIYYGSRYSFQSSYKSDFQACKASCIGCWGADYNCQTGLCILFTYEAAYPCGDPETCSLLFITPAVNRLSYTPPGK